MLKSRDVGEVDIVVNNAAISQIALSMIWNLRRGEDNSNEFGLTLLEREIFLARDAKEKVGPLRRIFLQTWSACR